jgi:MarR family 2-MHQ and catechol resistance regulon transcriptional repressor
MEHMTKLTAKRGEPSDAQPLGGQKVVEADPVTLAGLVFETATGLRRLVGPGLERDYSFPPQSFEVLIRLARSPGRRLRMSDLAAQTALTPSGLTRAIDRLVDAGLVCRHACPEDRRGAFAALSKEGAERMEMALGCHSRQLNDLLEGVLDAGERVHLTVLLRRLRDHVNPGAARVSEA